MLKVKRFSKCGYAMVAPPGAKSSDHIHKHQISRDIVLQVHYLFFANNLKKEMNCFPKGLLQNMFIL